MKKIVFTEEFCNPRNLVPFTLTRQVQDIRVGILTIREKWERHLKMDSFDKFEDDYKDLGRVVTIDESIGNDIVYLVHGNVLPTKKLVKAVKKLSPGEALSVPELESLVYCISKKQVIDKNNIKVGKTIDVNEEVKEVKAPWNIFGLNVWAIEEDFDLITSGRSSKKISSSNKVANTSNIFIEKDAVVESCYLNATDGPIY
ncbi:MAG: hypothetical protein M3Y85_01265, partial [Bacteroidota bacterium]|nr:hypothetical protein [Bacteroidota bacterium]